MRHVHSPRVRRLAAQSGVALTHLVGTGPAGRVTVVDVHRAAATRDAGPSAEPTKPPVSSPAPVTTVVEVDVTRLVRLDDRLRVFLARAVIEALRAHPEFDAVTFNAGILPPQQGTFMLADSGSREVLFDIPLLPPGQVAILGTGAVVERPVVVRRSDGEAVIAIRSMVYLALTYDAGLVDAIGAARFLTTVRTWLTKDPHAAQ